MACTDIIWQPAGHLLEIQKTITQLTSEEEKGCWTQCGCHGEILKKICLELWSHEYKCFAKKQNMLVKFKQKV